MDKYEHLDQQKAKIQEAKASNPNQSFESSLQARINAFGGEDQLSWIMGTILRKSGIGLLKEGRLIVSNRR
jgi:hypothetical protein